MDYTERLDNVYLIDTKMFGFDRYGAAYLVRGEEIALVDTGPRDRLEAVLQAITGHGFSPRDISRIFVTHSHVDHCGNVAPLLRESPDAKVYIHPAGVEGLVNPTVAKAVRKKAYSKEMSARLPDVEPVPASRIEPLNDGDVFDLGKGEKLRIIFAPGHQPEGIVILGEKNRGLFINDLVGNCLPDANAHYPLNPPFSDPEQAIRSLTKLLDVPVDYLCLGHYGFCDGPKEVMTRAIAFMKQLLEIGIKYIDEGRPEIIPGKVFEMLMPELEKLKPVRGEELYRYATQDHVASQVKIFAEYCQQKFGKG